MNHQDAEQMLARRSELTQTEEARLEEHLQSCSQCRETAEAYARQASLMRALPVTAPPPALRAGVLAGIRQRPRRWIFRPVFALGPLGLAAVAVFAALVYQNRPSSVSTPNQSAQPPFSARPSPVPATSQKQASLSRAPQNTHRSGKQHDATLSIATPSSSQAGGSVARGSTRNGTAYYESAPASGANQSFGPLTPAPSSRKAVPGAAPRHNSSASASTSASNGGKPTAPPVRHPAASPKPKGPPPPTAVVTRPQPPTPVVAAPLAPATPTPTAAPGSPVAAAASSATPTPTQTP